MNAQHPIPLIMVADISGSASLHQRLNAQEADRAIDRCIKRMSRSVEGYQGKLLQTAGDEILAILQKLNKERGVTTICATHDHRMMNICDRLMWIRDGGIERIVRRDEVEVEVGHIE